MGYASNSKEINEGSALGVGIHQNVFLVEGKGHTTEPKKEDGDTYEVLDFTFKNKKGDFHTRRIFNPENGNASQDEVKLGVAQKNAADVAVYILSKITGKDIELPSVDSWDEFTKAVIDLLPVDYDKIPMELMLVGNVYKGKATVISPNVYNGGFIGGSWLARMDSSDRLKITDQAKKMNAAYEDALVRTSSTGTAAPAAGGESAATDDLVF